VRANAEPFLDSQPTRTTCISQKAYIHAYAKLRKVWSKAQAKTKKRRRPASWSSGFGKAERAPLSPLCQRGWTQVQPVNSAFMREYGGVRGGKGQLIDAWNQHNCFAIASADEAKSSPEQNDRCADCGKGPVRAAGKVKTKTEVNSPRPAVRAWQYHKIVTRLGTARIQEVTMPSARTPDKDLASCCYETSVSLGYSAALQCLCMPNGL